ncbi:hypothetical protein SAMN04487934_1138 [Eubacterium ruminantium]|nr:hypothetical protein SAMN04487934_1138 [Eubacterium ruminantium]
MGVFIPREDVDRAGKIGLYEYFCMISPNVLKRGKYWIRYPKIEIISETESEDVS